MRQELRTSSENIPLLSQELKGTIKNKLGHYRNLLFAGLISFPGILGAQNPNSISQSDKLGSTRHDTIRSSLDGTIVEPGHHHVGEKSGELQAHINLSVEALTRAILPKGERASDGAVSSLEVDLYAQRGDVSVHAMAHDISPLSAQDKLHRELATSLTVKYDHNPFHIAAGLRHYDHTGKHKHLHESREKHIDHGHEVEIVHVHEVESLVREKYLAFLAQAGVDLGEHVTAFFGAEYDLGISKDNGQGETHLTFAGLDTHTHWKAWHLAARFLVAHSHGNINEPDSTFVRPSLHIENEVLTNLYLTLFAEFVAGNNRDSVFSGGIGFRKKF